MSHAKFNLNQFMLTLIFGIQASEPPPPPGSGERLKRPSLIGLNINTKDLVQISSRHFDIELRRPLFERTLYKTSNKPRRGSLSMPFWLFDRKMQACIFSGEIDLKSL